MTFCPLHQRFGRGRRYSVAASALASASCAASEPGTSVLLGRISRPTGARL